MSEKFAVSVSPAEGNLLRVKSEQFGWSLYLEVSEARELGSKLLAAADEADEAEGDELGPKSGPKWSALTQALVENFNEMYAKRLARREAEADR